MTTKSHHNKEGSLAPTIDLAILITTYIRTTVCSLWRPKIKQLTLQKLTVLYYESLENCKRTKDLPFFGSQIGTGLLPRSNIGIPREYCSPLLIGETVSVSVKPSTAKTMYRVVSQPQGTNISNIILVPSRLYIFETNTGVLCFPSAYVTNEQSADPNITFKPPKCWSSKADTLADRSLVRHEIGSI